MAYNTTVNGIGFSFNFDNEVLSIDALTERLDADSLQIAAREAETSEMGIVFPQIINTSGKVTLDSESETGLNVVLQNTWLILSLKTSGLFTVSGGNVVSDINGVEIFAPNPTVDTQNNTSQAGVRVLSETQDILAALDRIESRVNILPELSDITGSQDLFDLVWTGHDLP